MKKSSRVYHKHFTTNLNDPGPYTSNKLMYPMKKKSKITKKVYCKSCKYFERYPIIMGIPGSIPDKSSLDKCKRHDAKKYIKDTYYEREVIEGYWEPSVKNAKNDCKDYEAK